MRLLNPRILFSKKHFNLINGVYKLNKLQLRSSSVSTNLKYNRDQVTFIQETIIGRFLIYLNMADKPKSSDKIKNLSPANKNNQNNLLNGLDEDKANYLDLDEIIECLHCVKQYKNADRRNRFMAIIDKEFCRRAEQLSSSEILKILQTYIMSAPKDVSKYKFYDVGLKNLTFNLSCLDKSEIIQTIFLSGFKKKEAVSRIRIDHCLRRLDYDSLTEEDLCIICLSTFKASMKLGKFPKFIDKIHDFINNNLRILKDPALFITLIKTIRHNRSQNDDLLSTISCTIFFNRAFDNYCFLELCHILALFADYKYYDKAVFDNFTKKCLEELKTSTFISPSYYKLDILRGKDIHRFLWCLSTINYKFNDNFNETHIREIIIPKLIGRIKGFEFSRYQGLLLEIFLYLWMLNYRAKELIPYVFTKENIEFIRASPGPSKQRLNLLLTMISHEDRPLYDQLDFKPSGPNEYKVKDQIDKRPVLQRVYSTLKSSLKKLKISRLELDLAVSYLNIAGIIGYKKNKKLVFIEVLDDYTTIKNVGEGKVVPTGLMQTKLRIINGFEEGFVVINAVDIESMTEAELKKYLFDEIDLVC